MHNIFYPVFHDEHLRVKRQFYLTYPENICIRLHGRSVDQFFKFIDYSYNLVQQEDKLEINSIPIENIGFTYRILSEDEYKQLKTDPRTIYYF